MSLLDEILASAGINPPTSTPALPSGPSRPPAANQPGLGKPPVSAKPPVQAPSPPPKSTVAVKPRPSPIKPPVKRDPVIKASTGSVDLLRRRANQVQKAKAWEVLKTKMVVNKQGIFDQNKPPPRIIDLQKVGKFLGLIDDEGKTEEEKQKAAKEASERSVEDSRREREAQAISKQSAEALCSYFLKDGIDHKGQFQSVYDQEGKAVVAEASIDLGQVLAPGTTLALNTKVEVKSLQTTISALLTHGRSFNPMVEVADDPRLCFARMSGRAYGVSATATASAGLKTPEIIPDVEGLEDVVSWKLKASATAAMGATYEAHLLSVRDAEPRLYTTGAAFKDEFALLLARSKHLAKREVCEFINRYNREDKSYFEAATSWRFKTASATDLTAALTYGIGKIKGQLTPGPTLTKLVEDAEAHVAALAPYVKEPTKADTKAGKEAYEALEKKVVDFLREAEKTARAPQDEGFFEKVRYENLINSGHIASEKLDAILDTGMKLLTEAKAKSKEKKAVERYEKILTAARDYRRELRRFLKNDFAGDCSLDLCSHQGGIGVKVSANVDIRLSVGGSPESSGGEDEAGGEDEQPDEEPAGDDGGGEGGQQDAREGGDKEKETGKKAKKKSGWHRGVKLDAAAIHTESSVRRSSYRFQSFKIDPELPESVASGKTPQDAVDPSAYFLYAPDEAARRAIAKNVLRDLRQNAPVSTRRAIMTQDTVILYLQSRLDLLKIRYEVFKPATSGKKAEAPTKGEYQPAWAKDLKEEGTWCAISYESAVLHWFRSEAGSPVTLSDLSSGYSFGLSVRMENLAAQGVYGADGTLLLTDGRPTLTIEPHNLGYRTGLAQELHVTLQQLESFLLEGGLAACEALLCDPNFNAEAVLIESSFGIDGARFHPPKKEAGVGEFSQSIRWFPKEGGAKRRTPRGQLQAIRLRYRIQDRDAKSSAKFRLGFKWLGSGGSLELKDVSEAGSDGIFDVLTVWFGDMAPGQVPGLSAAARNYAVPPVILFDQ